jgi:hypothetical protein
MTVDDKITGFVTLIDRAIEIAKERIKLRDQGLPDSAPPGALEYIIKGLSQYREEATSGKLSPSEGTVTLGVLREVGDWGESSDSALFRAARDLEDYYLNQLK